MRWIAAAAAFHAGAFALLLLCSARHSDGPDAKLSSRAEEPSELTISLESEPLVVAPGERSDGAEPQRREPAPARAGSAAVAGGGMGAGESVATVGSSTVPASDSFDPGGSSPEAPRTGGNGSAVVPIPLSAAELGIGGRNPFLPRTEEKAPTGADHPAARAMRGTGLAHDRALGLGPEGPAIAALSDATTSSIAPLRGHATFVVRTGGDGLVSAIDLIDSDGGTGWLDAGRIALERLRGKKMSVPRGATGMNMHIEVRSEMKLPNGENAPVGTRRGESGMPEMTIPDVSNIGAKPRRVVHARAVGTDLL